MERKALKSKFHQSMLKVVESILNHIQGGCYKMVAEIALEGVDELIAKLNALGANLSTLSNKAIRAGAEDKEIIKSPRGMF